MIPIAPTILIALGHFIISMGQCINSYYPDTTFTSKLFDFGGIYACLLFAQNMRFHYKKA